MFQNNGFLSEFKSLDPMINSFSLRQIKAATNNFDTANRIGEGGFGPVHKVKKPKRKITTTKRCYKGVLFAL